MTTDLLPLLMFATLCGGLLLGYPVALTLAGVALGFAALGSALNAFEPAYLRAFPNRILGAMRNQVLIAVPLFILMGAVLEKSGIASDLLLTTQKLVANVRGGLAYAIIAVGALLAASTGIVGATVVTMTLLALPTMLRQGYDTRLSCGTIAAAGTLGQIIPPSIVLIVLADVIANANAQAARAAGNVPTPVSVGDMFAGALIPGVLLVAAYMLLVWVRSRLTPDIFPPTNTIRTSPPNAGTVLLAVGAPVLLIVAVLGSILGGLASPTEAAAIGAVGALLLAALKCTRNSPTLTPVFHLVTGGIAAVLAVLLLTWAIDTTRGAGAALAAAASLLVLAAIGGSVWVLARRGLVQQSLTSCARMTSMVFLILIGAALFSIVFRGLGGDQQIETLLSSVPGGLWGALLLSMLVMFILGFVLDFLEITFILVPLIAPQLIALGADPVWLGVLIAINLQTSFLTPPFGFALFYLKGAAPQTVVSTDIWRGALPFIAIQILVVALVAAWPILVWQAG